MSEPRTIDLTESVWGRRIEVTHVHDAGQRISGATWTPPHEMPRIGDYVLVPTGKPGKPSSRYQVMDVKPCLDPMDMAFVELAFAPRSVPGEG